MACFDETCINSDYTDTNDRWGIINCSAPLHAGCIDGATFDMIWGCYSNYLKMTIKHLVDMWLCTCSCGQHINLSVPSVLLKFLLKAAIFNIFTVTIDQITISNVKGVTRGDEPRENYYLDLQLLSALQRFRSFSTSGFDFFVSRRSGSLSCLLLVSFSDAAVVKCPVKIHCFRARFKWRLTHDI